MAKEKEKKKKKKVDEELEIGELQTGSLAVKYRPIKIEDLIGQGHVVQKIQGAIANRKIPAGFLIVGGTGRGKTTTARIIARYLNCKKMNGCGKCENCTAFGDSGAQHPDYEEINVADERGIDQLRAVISKARNRPRLGRFRIILLDEVHQLTPQAAEVLLKPLEEPPPQTLWMLGTTDPEKLKQTIIKRLMPLHMLAVPKETIAKRIKFIAKKEEIVVKDKVIDLIAELSGGHVRDGIMLLESAQAAISGGAKKTSEIIKIIEQDAQNSSDSNLEAKAIDTLVTMLGLSLKSFWKIASQFSQGEEVNLANKCIYMVSYLIEDSAAGGRGPMIWHNALNVKFKKSVQANLNAFDLSSYGGLARATSLLDQLVRLRNDLVMNSGAPRALFLSRLAQWIVNQKRVEGVEPTKKPKKK